MRKQFPSIVSKRHLSGKILIEIVINLRFLSDSIIKHKWGPLSKNRGSLSLPVGNNPVNRHRHADAVTS